MKDIKEMFLEVYDKIDRYQKENIDEIIINTYEHQKSIELTRKYFEDFFKLKGVRDIFKDFQNDSVVKIESKDISASFKLRIKQGEIDIVSRDFSSSNETVNYLLIKSKNDSYNYGIPPAIKNEWLEIKSKLEEKWMEKIKIYELNLDEYINSIEYLHREIVRDMITKMFRYVFENDWLSEAVFYNYNKYVLND